MDQEISDAGAPRFMRSVLGRIFISIMALGLAACAQNDAPQDKTSEKTISEDTHPEDNPEDALQGQTDIDASPGDMVDDDRWATLTGAAPLIIAHRGASGERPEHTLSAYALAIEQGADIIEPDLVVSKDGVLMARHDRYLSTTTDIADHPEFADRKRPDAYAAEEGLTRADWWVEDFTLAELKTLRARQPRPDRSKEFDGQFGIPTFTEVLDLATRKSKETGRAIGVYPETKHPGFFEEIGLDFEAPLLAALKGFDNGPVFIQSFEADILKRLRGKTAASLVQLVYEEAPGAGVNIPLTDIKDYAQGVGPAKGLLIDEDGPSGFVSEAHRLGLFVHPWTFREDDASGDFADALSALREDALRGQTLAGASANQSEAFDIYQRELVGAYALGIDGVFTDFPDSAVVVRENLDTVYKRTTD